jgi:predicted Zn-dependent peptidase
MLLLLPFVAALSAGDSIPDPVSIAEAAQDPAAAVVVHRQPAIPVVALRLSLLVDDPPGLAGAGHLIQHLVYPSLQEQARRAGGEAQIERTPDAMIYTVTGPASELAHLSRALRSVLHPPVASDAVRLGAHRKLAEERLAEWETAAGHARAALRAQLFPADLSQAGTAASALRLREEPLDVLWAELYRPDRVMVTAVGDVELPEVQAAFSDLPDVPSATGERGDAEIAAPRVPLAPAEATRGWMGRGYLAVEAEPATLSVTARLLGDHLRDQLPAADVSAEHWWTHYGQALVAVVAVPGDSIRAAQRALDTAVAALLGNLTQEEVREAATAVRRDMLFYARTPERMAQVLGRFTDRYGDPDAAQRFYAELEQVGEAEVKRLLRQFADRTPVRVEIPPQNTMSAP